MQIQSPFQATFNGQTFNSFADYFFNVTSEYGTRLALVDVDSGKQWRYAELSSWSNKCGQRLREIGVGQNSCVALVASSSPVAIFVHLACASLGCRLAPINGLLSVDEIWHQVDLAEVTHCIVESQFAQKIEDVKRKALMRGSARIRVIKRLDEVVGDAPLTVLQKRDSKAQFTQQQKDDPETDTASIVSGSTVVLREKPNRTGSTEDSNYVNDGEPGKSNAYLILFSSGTTRQPKPVQITHQTLISNLQCLKLPIFGPPSTSDRFLLTLCMSTLFGFYSTYHALTNGSELYIIRKYANKLFLKALVEYRITYVHVTPSMLMFLANDLSLENVTLKPHLRTIISGGAPLDPRIAKQCKERLGLRDLRQVYGMTELGGPSLMAYIGCENIEGVRPLPGVIAKIVQWDSKKLCGPRQPGQLLITGTNIFANIYRNTKATSDLLTSDGFVKTGDAAQYDEQGLIFVLDRAKDIIKYRGTLVCPSDVESTLRSHPGIEDCAVVGRQDHVSGEVPAAFVVKRNTHLMLSTSEIRQHVSGKIPQFKELRGGVFFVSEIPRSICGKIQRQNLRQHWDRERLGSRSEINGISALAKDPATVMTNSLRKTPKTPDELPKSRRSASITPATGSKVARPVVRRLNQQKKNNKSTD